ncbi:MAG: ABC transporter ATP-binding protein [Paracoccaceae bacterium]
MSISHLLEDFGTQSAGRSSIAMTDVSLEEQRLESFEQGYKAGWDDALKAQNNTAVQISEEFARNLQDLSFTYREAYAHILKSMNPLLSQIVETVLPEMAQKTLGLRVIEQLQEMVKATGDTGIEVRVSCANQSAVASLLKQEFGFPVAIKDDASLSDTQALLKFDETEKQIDLGEVLSGIGQAVSGFFHEHQKEVVNG